MLATALLLSLLAEAAQPTAASAAATAATQSEQVSDKKQAAALALARLYMPVDTLIEAEVKLFDTQFEAQMLKNPSVAELEKKAPGTIAAMANAARPLIGELQTRNVARGQADVAALFAKRLSDQEIAELTDFYQQPDVRSALRKVALGVDASKTFEKVALNPDYQVQTSDLDNNITTGIANSEGQMTAAEKAAMESLETKQAFKRLVELDPEISEIMVAGRNRPDPEIDARLEAVMGKALEEHLAKAAAKPNGSK